MDVARRTILQRCPWLDVAWRGLMVVVVGSQFGSQPGSASGQASGTAQMLAGGGLVDGPRTRVKYLLNLP